MCRVDLRDAARRDEIEEPGLVASLLSHLIVTKFSKCLLLVLTDLQFQNTLFAWLFGHIKEIIMSLFDLNFTKNMINLEELH